MKKILVLLVTIMLVFTGCSNDSGAENNNDLTGGTAGIIIVTSPYGEEDMIIKMISCEDEKLFLDFNGEERVFELEEE